MADSHWSCQDVWTHHCEGRSKVHDGQGFRVENDEASDSTSLVGKTAAGWKLAAFLNGFMVSKGFLFHTTRVLYGCFSLSNMRCYDIVFMDHLGYPFPYIPNSIKVEQDA